MSMKRAFLLSFFVSFLLVCCKAQTTGSNNVDMRNAALRFLQELSTTQKTQALFSFADEERYRWNYVPTERKGIPLKNLNNAQYQLAMEMLRSALSDTGYAKTRAIIDLENILKEVENRSADDHYRDPGKYCVSLFGNPQTDSVWGWRFEGHHVAFNFTAAEKGLVSGTPGFLGANPAVVQTGLQKGKEVLKEETKRGFALLHSLDEEQRKKTILSPTTPGEIITANSRKAMIEKPQGILYSELNSDQQSLLLQLLRLYINRYKQPIAAMMMKEIEAAGLVTLRFAWAGAEQPGLGHPHYYRIQGPTLIIEYDNTQNNANHVHTVIRDLKNDFGDQLLDHYRHNRH
jgi:hypothetical protein